MNQSCFTLYKYVTKREIFQTLCTKLVHSARHLTRAMLFTSNVSSIQFTLTKWSSVSTILAVVAIAKQTARAGIVEWQHSGTLPVSCLSMSTIVACVPLAHRAPPLLLACSIASQGDCPRIRSWVESVNPFLPIVPEEPDSHHYHPTYC